jgi:DNA-binding CsgD family transcriptional regulator
MSAGEQFDTDGRKEETFHGQPCIAILDDKEWSYVQRYYDMSPRELEVAKLVCSGFTNSDIAKKLNVCTGTVKTHLRSIFGKTRTRNRISMLLKYIEKVHQFHHQNDVTYTTADKSREGNIQSGQVHFLE